MKYGESCAVKLPIAFPSLITEIILNQHPTILRPNEAESKKPLQLSFNYKLFAGEHVPD
ncbi:envelope-like protein, partial [Trifolium medium]|nr:envelope-like protein [Trifolium medium]